MKPPLIIVALSLLLPSCATTNTGTVRRPDADFWYTDWRSMPPQEAFDVCAAPQEGMTTFIANIRLQGALRRGIRGEVKVLVSLDSSGRVLDVRVIQSLDPDHDRIVVDAVYHTRWTPALKKGSPIPFKFYLPVEFI